MAQPYGDSKFKQKFNKADALVFDGKYVDALPLLEDMYKFDSTNANLNYLLGVSYMLGKKDYPLAIKRLESSTKDVSLEYNEANWKERKAPGIAYYYLGRAYHFKNQFDRAVTNYYNYRSFIEMDDVETYNKVRQQIQYAENAMELTKHPVGVRVTNLGPTINTEYPEYCPVISADGKVLIFTSRREGGVSDAKDQDGNYYDDIYICNRQPNGTWSKPSSIGTTINTAGHEAAIGLSPNGQLLFIYKDDNGDGNIYYSEKKGDGWSSPQLMGSDINTPSWETHASVNATEDLLVFVSNRNEGGFGGRDLWYSKRLPNGEWGLAQNMGSVINSQYEEDSPFISADGKTLIFSSQGHTSMGGFDIFRSEFVDGAWTIPENIGYPISSSEDDVFFVLTPDGQQAYYSSKKDGGFGDSDIYRLKLEVKKAEGAAVARGVMKVPAMQYTDINAKIVVTDEEGQQVGTYLPNPNSGYYVLILPPGETYEVTYLADGYGEVVAKLPVAYEDVYAEYDGTLELDEVVFGENILALQKETERLEEEKRAAKAKAIEDEKLAMEAAAKAAEEAEEETVQLALEKEKQAELLKAEQLAQAEKERAAKELAAEQEKNRLAEIARKKAEAKARFEAEQALAAKQKREAEEKAAAKLAEEQRLLAEAKAAEEAAIKLKEKELETARKAEMLAAKQAAELEERQRAEELARQQKEAQEAEAAKIQEEFKAAELAAVEKLKAEKAAKAEAERLAMEEAAKAEEALVAAKKAQEEEEKRLAAEKAVKEAEALALAKQAEMAAVKEAAELEEKRKADELAQKEAAEKELQAKKDLEAKELADAKAQKEEEAKKAEEQQRAEYAEAAEQRRLELQQRIQSLKQKQENQPDEQVAEVTKVKEVSLKDAEPSKEQSTVVDADAIKAKREMMLKKIQELKNQQANVEQKKTKDEEVVVETTEKLAKATTEKKELELEAESKKEEVAKLEQELEVVNDKVADARIKVENALEEKNAAEEALKVDVIEQNRLAEEEARKLEEAQEAQKQIEELERQEKERLEAERLAAEEFKKQQQEEAERTQRELIQLEALAEQQRQVNAAMEAEKKKKAAIEAAEESAFSDEERLANANTLEQLREINQKLIADNLELKKQLAELNSKLDMILARIEYQPDVEKVEIPASSTMKNLQEGKRLVLRNIYFDYNLATLRSKSKHELNKLFNFMKENPDVDIVVSGHTDSKGDDNYNLRLSKDRASAVVEYLTRNGISPSRLTARGYGETRPIARNENADSSDNPVGRQLNRRIEISMPRGVEKGVEFEQVQIPNEARIK